MFKNTPPANDSYFEEGEMTTLAKGLREVEGFQRGQVALKANTILVHQGADGAISVSSNNQGKIYIGDLT